MDANHLTTPQADRLETAGNQPCRPTPSTNPAAVGPLYWNPHTGLVACLNHAGHYLTAALQRDHTTISITTPLGTWNRVTTSDRRDWTEEFGTEIACETCTHTH